MPVTLDMSDLPADGEVLTDFELSCDPEERLCKVRARILCVQVSSTPKYSRLDGHEIGQRQSA